MRVLMSAVEGDGVLGLCGEGREGPIGDLNGAAETQIMVGL